MLVGRNLKPAKVPLATPLLPLDFFRQFAVRSPEALEPSFFFSWGQARDACTGQGSARRTPISHDGGVSWGKGMLTTFVWLHAGGFACADSGAPPFKLMTGAWSWLAEGFATDRVTITSVALSLHCGQVQVLFDSLTEHVPRLLALLCPQYVVTRLFWHHGNQQTEVEGESQLAVERAHTTTWVHAQPSSEQESKALTPQELPPLLARKPVTCGLVR